MVYETEAMEHAGGVLVFGLSGRVLAELDHNTLQSLTGDFAAALKNHLQPLCGPYRHMYVMFGAWIHLRI